MNIYHYGHSNDDHSVYHQDKQVDGHCDDYDDDQDDDQRDDESNPICKIYINICIYARWFNSACSLTAAASPPLDSKRSTFAFA